MVIASPNLTRRGLGGLLLGCTAVGMARAAETLPLPAEKTILTVSGKISNRNVGDTANFDRAMLESLGMDGFQTSTPWYNGVVQFDGVRMTRLMQAVGAVGSTVMALALNDYTTELPIADFEQYGVLLAIKRDGAYMPVRDKGPLFIVYPFDEAPELRAHKYYSRSAWQVAKIIVT